jgi:hypothetical protein
MQTFVICGWMPRNEKVVLVLGGAGAPAHAGQNGETEIRRAYIKRTNLDWLVADLRLGLSL